MSRARNGGGPGGAAVSLVRDAISAQALAHRVGVSGVAPIAALASLASPAGGLVLAERAAPGSMLSAGHSGAFNGIVVEASDAFLPPLHKR